MCLACFADVFPPYLAGHDRSPFPGAASPIPWPDGRASGGTILWTGVAGFVIEHGGTRIAFDPFVTRPGVFDVLFRQTPPDGAAATARFSGLDAVFVGHTHYDHAMDLPAVVAASPRARVHGSRTTGEICRRLGVPAASLVEVHDGGRYPVGRFVVEAIASEHGKVPLVGWVDRLDLPPQGVPRTPFRWPRGDVFAWRVTVAGRTFHVQGSAGIDELPLERQSPADVLIACLAARRGTPRYLERLADRLRPKVLVPCHHDDFFRPLSEPPRAVAGLAWKRFLGEAAAMERAHGTKLWLPCRGEPSSW
jgi:L-ascorbate metabolism protein UlaG (beta-lactamase superfamily)